MPVTSDPDHGLRIRIDHLSSKHHSDVLKSSINTQMVEKLELSEHPTLNYRNALKHTYRDQLDKTLSYQQQKRWRQARIELINDRQGLTELLQSNYRQCSNQRSSTRLSNYADYDQFQSIKCSMHTNKNYDGGNSFFAAQDAYLKHKEEQMQHLKNSLKDQLQEKENKRLLNITNLNLQRTSLLERRIQDSEAQLRQNQHKKNQQAELRKAISEQIKEQQQRNSYGYHQSERVQRKCRHNPILNPIQYHIDNPYILKIMQGKGI